MFDSGLNKWTNDPIPAQQLRALDDTSMPTLGSGQDGYVVSFDYVSDKFVVRPDNSGLPEAPIDGLSYVRKDEAWEADPIQTDAPNDGLRYI